MNRSYKQTALKGTFAPSAPALQGLRCPYIAPCSGALDAYLIVPVGDGKGDGYAASCSGMFILNGATCLCLGGLGTRLGFESSTRDENQILMFVDGNLRMHLESKHRFLSLSKQW